MPKDQGAEQGDVDGPLECSSALGLVAAETRMHVVAQQTARTLPWIVVGCRQSTPARCRKDNIFLLGWPTKLTGADDPPHAPQDNGGLTDQWYVDDGDILCHLILVPFCVQDFDDANDNIGAERNPQKTEIIYHVADLDAAPLQWKIDEVRQLASVSTVAAGSKTLRVAV